MVNINPPHLSSNPLSNLPPQRGEARPISLGGNPAKTPEAPAVPGPAAGRAGTFSFAPSKPEKKSYLPRLAAALAVLLILGGGYFVFFYLGVNLFAPPALPPAPALTVLETKVSRLPKFSFEVLDSPLFKSLKVRGVVPVKTDVLGRPNPFIPY